MKITFEHADRAGVYENQLSVKTSDGLPIIIYFHDLDASVISLGGSEYEVSEDGYQGLYVNFGHGIETNIIPVSEVIRQANAAIEHIVSETAAERRSWDRHAKSCSQPSL